MNEENTLEQALDGSLSDDRLRAMLEDATRRAEFAEQVRLDAALRVLFEPNDTHEVLTEAILASAHLHSQEEVMRRILSDTVGQSRLSRQWAKLRVKARPLRRYAIAAAVALGAWLGATVWPDLVRGTELQSTIATRLGKPFALPGDQPVPPLPASMAESAPLLVAATEPSLSDKPSGQSPAASASTASTLPAQNPRPLATSSAAAPSPTPASANRMPAASPNLATAATAASPEAPPMVSGRIIAEPGTPTPASLAKVLPGHVEMSPSASLPLPAEGQPLDFQQHILPLFSKACFECHSANQRRPKGSLRLDDLAWLRVKMNLRSVIVPGSSDLSLIYQRLTKPAGHKDLMPPAKSATRLSEQDIQLIGQWIKEGANFGTWTSSEVLAKP